MHPTLGCMRPRPKALACLSSTTVVLGLALLGPADGVHAADANAAASQRIFFIKRSKNANEVHYDARVSNCAWGQPQVDYYWRDLQKGPNVISEIKPWESPAYGFAVSEASDSEITMVLGAVPTKRIRVRLSRSEGGACRLSNTVDISGQAAELDAVYVYTTENLIGVPKVHYVDVLGHSPQGQRVYERIANVEHIEQFAPPNESLWKSGARSTGRP